MDLAREPPAGPAPTARTVPIIPAMRAEANRGSVLASHRLGGSSRTSGMSAAGPDRARECAAAPGPVVHRRRRPRAARSSCTRTALYFSFLEVGPPASSPPGLTFAILGVTEIPGRPRSGDLVVMTRHGWSRRCDDTI
jgi:hypothetical protein